MIQTEETLAVLLRTTCRAAECDSCKRKLCDMIFGKKAPADMKQEEIVKKVKEFIGC